jgi:hypothetical protein
MIGLRSSCVYKFKSRSFWYVKFLKILILKGHITSCLRSFTFGQIKLLLTVEVVLLIWSGGLASRLQFPVVLVIVVTRT